VSTVAAPTPAPSRRRNRTASVVISRRGRVALTAFFALFLVVLYLPTGLLVLFSFDKGDTQTFPLRGFTTSWYRAAWNTPAIHDALKNSFILGVIVAVIATVLGVMVSYPLARKRFAGKSVVSALVLLPLVVPTVVLGIALLILFRRGPLPHSLGLYDLGLADVGIGHVVIALPFCVLLLMPRIAAIDRRLEEAAHDLGASGLTTFRRIILPLITPAVLSSLLIAFVVSIDEVVIASFLVRDQVTYPIYLFSSLRLGQSIPVLIPVATVMITISFALALLAEVIRRVGERRVGLASRT